VCSDMWRKLHAPGATLEFTRCTSCMGGWHLRQHSEDVHQHVNISIDVAVATAVPLLISLSRYSSGSHRDHAVWQNTPHAQHELCHTPWLMHTDFLNRKPLMDAPRCMASVGRWHHAQGHGSHDDQGQAQDRHRGPASCIAVGVRASHGQDLGDWVSMCTSDAWKCETLYACEWKRASAGAEWPRNFWCRCWPTPPTTHFNFCQAPSIAGQRQLAVFFATAAFCVWPKSSQGVGCTTICVAVGFVDTHHVTTSAV
jgi:hypothetical protein